MFPLNPFDYLRVTMKAAQIMAESQTVIGLRLAGMAGLWPMGGAENSRMVSEKMEAGAQAHTAAMKSAMAGGTLSDIAMAAMKPVGARTSANARRLAKKAVRNAK